MSKDEVSTYLEMGEYWDNHDLGDVWEQTEAVEMKIDIQGSVFYFPVESKLSNQLRELAYQHGVSPETLLNLWLQERVVQEQTKSSA